MLTIMLLAVMAAAAAGADELPAKALPGNKPCPYPPQAQKNFVAGSVRFAVQVRPDGTAESVDVQKVPLPDQDFESTVRDCVSQWKFEPAPEGHTALRRYEGSFRFRLDAAEEAALRGMLESLATAWNADDMGAVDALALKDSDLPGRQPGAQPSLRDQLEGKRGERRWQMQLAPEMEHVRFMNGGIANLTQLYRRIYQGEQAPESKEFVLNAFVAKGSRGWRLVSASSAELAWRTAFRVGAGIKEPHKVKDVKPVYPEGPRENGIQGVVILECVISPEGKVASVRILKGFIRTWTRPPWRLCAIGSTHQRCWMAFQCRSS